MANSLEELNASGKYCSITQNGISKLKNIKVLNCSDNKNICDVNHLGTTLEKLSCCDNTGLGQKGISNLKNIRTLICSNNKDIADVNYLADTLEILGCRGKCGIDQNG